MNKIIQDEFATNIDRLSALTLYSDVEYEGDEKIFPQGYNQINKYLSDWLDIHFGHVVKEVFYHKNNVNVVTNKQTFNAEKIIITIPLGVLKDSNIIFNPPLPQKKKSAIEKLGMGVYNKLFLHFDKIFWDKNIDLISLQNFNNTPWLSWLNLSQVINAPILCCVYGGEIAKEYEKLTDREIVNSAMDVLKKIYGKNIPNPSKYYITRWFSDPYSRGSYSYTSAGTSHRERQLLAEPVNHCLYFAGEATHSELSATVHGALLSGRREAARIMTESILKVQPVVR